MKVLQFISNAFLITLLTATVANADAQKTAYAHFERAVSEVNDGKKAIEGLQKEMADRKSKIEKMHKDLEAFQAKGQKELQALQEAAQKQSGVMSAEARKAKEMEFANKAGELQKELQKKEMALRTEYANAEKDFQKRQAEVMAPITKKMQEIAAAISSEHNYDAIGDLGKMIYVKPELDVTNELIRRYNASSSAKSAKK